MFHLSSTQIGSPYPRFFPQYTPHISQSNQILTVALRHKIQSAGLHFQYYDKKEVNRFLAVSKLIRFAECVRFPSYIPEYVQ